MIAADIAAGMVGVDNVNRDFPSSMGGEDFAFCSKNVSAQ